MSSKSMPSNADVVVVGGGLAGSLTALRLSLAKPDLKIAVLIEGSKVSEGETWLFRGSDLSEESVLWLKPVITKSWDGHDVVFPHVAQSFAKGYHAIRSEDLDRVLRERLGDSLFFNITVTEANSTGVTSADGQTIDAGCVLDARTPSQASAPVRNGFRKSMSYDLTLEDEHGLKNPVSIDATVPQLDGFRFFRILPWDEKAVVIEEVFHSNTPDLNPDRLSRSVKSYAERKGWKVASTDRTETRVRPLPMTAESIAFTAPAEPLRLGLAGGYLHAATGEELPDAVRFAEFISSIPDLKAASAREALLKFRRSWASKQRFFRLVNRFVFFASEPALRYQVYQQIYSLPDDVADRFFGGKITWGDRLRILRNRPQAVKFKRAVRSLRERFIHERLTSAEP